jgi:hypothetical protein
MRCQNGAYEFPEDIFTDPISEAAEGGLGEPNTLLVVAEIHDTRRTLRKVVYATCDSSVCCRGLLKGVLVSDDKGLDHTPPWGRTYWGGALFCSLADIEIHEWTQNRHILRDAWRGIVTANGSM